MVISSAPGIARSGSIPESVDIRALKRALFELMTATCPVCLGKGSWLTAYYGCPPELLPCGLCGVGDNGPYWKQYVRPVQSVFA